ncbi:MAG: UvrD-helicase domain-containing protein, partial [Streptosporangiaceae bacterium]
LLSLVERYNRAKAARVAIDHGDQVALAARIATGHPEVGAIERSRYTVVLLDEYQDTSHAQLVLLEALFGHGHPVTAVGDPSQSIYGWRGASAGNLRRFPVNFPRRDGSTAAVAPLGTSFRGGERILDLAGILSEPLFGSRVGEVAGSERLREDGLATAGLRPGPGRGERGRLACGLFASARDEAVWVADQVVDVLGLPEGAAPDGGPWVERRPAGSARVHPYDIAVLARKRAQLPALRLALEQRGVPVEVVGLGGLLTVPEVQDVVATLRILHDPLAGDALARLLTGARWRIGPRDLVALGRRARELARDTGRDVRKDAAPLYPPGQRPDDRDASAETPASDAGAAGLPPHAGGGGAAVPAVDAAEPRSGLGGGTDSGDPLAAALAEMSLGDEVSLVDALDDLGRPDRYSPEGRARLSALARELSELRGRLDQPLPDLVTDVERTLGLDVEVAARPGADPVAARADLDALVDAAARFAGDEEEPTLGAFLAYLAAAEDQEFGLETGRVSEADSVKLMTVHAAKGLEWPVVVVPGLAAGDGACVFPARPRTSTRWTDNARLLPFRLRGDRDDLPVLRGLDREARDRFCDECKRREALEERRLMYVAATRASYLLLCSGYWWGAGKKPLGPSVFLREVRDACAAGAGAVAAWAPEPPPEAANPVLAEPAAAVWPATAEGREGAVAGARFVEAALAGDPDPSRANEAGLADEDAARAEGWALDADLLLAERAQATQRDGTSSVELPDELSVSGLVSLARDPGELARQIRRPLPRAPAPYARRGTAFHRWVESRYGQQRLLDHGDLPGAADAGAAPDSELAELQRRFEASAWAARTPVDLEVPFEAVIRDRVVRGRIDAVFADADGRFDVVDWKTGARPAGADAGAAAVQLAAYRVAYAELAGVAVDRVRAAFHYVRTNETVRPADLLDAETLAALLHNVPETP